MAIETFASNGQTKHTTSYYAASANPSPERPPLKGDQQIDICIVGAGYSGLSTGLHLAEKGYKVAIIEGARVGWGASGRNGGQIVNGLNASLQTIKKRYGQDTANFVAGLVQEGGEIIRERVKTYDIQCDLKPGNIFTGLTSAHMKELEARRALWASYGIHNQDMLDKAQLREHVGSDLYEGGMIDHTGGHMHPLNLCLGEAAAFEKLGGVIYEQSPVIHVRYRSRKAGRQNRKRHDDLQHAGSVRQCLSWPCRASADGARHAGLDADDGDRTFGRGARQGACCQPTNASRMCAISSITSA